MSIRETGRASTPSVALTGATYWDMDLECWPEFERALDLRVLWKDYLGGFEPSIFARREDRTLIPYLLARTLKLLLSRRLGFLRRINGPRWSGYAMAVYRVGEDGGVEGP